MNQFLEVLSNSPRDVPRIALHAARLLSYPDLDVESYLDRIDQLAENARDASFDLSTDAYRAERLAKYLYHNLSLRGDVNNYTDPRNSFLNEVLDRGVGIPITLSIIYVAIARRVGLEAFGVSLPGHFIVAVGNDNEQTLVDPFNGKRLSGKDCARLVRETTGFKGSFKTEWLRPADEKDIVLRMLNNLRISYMREEQWEKALKTLALIDCVEPDGDITERDRGLINFAQQNYALAAEQLDRYLQKQPKGIDQNTLRHAIGPTIEKWAALN